jgi:hypothetical protein
LDRLCALDLKRWQRRGRSEPPLPWPCPAHGRGRDAEEAIALDLGITDSTSFMVG